MIVLTLPPPISANVYWRTAIVNRRANTYVSAEAKAFKCKVALILKLAGITKPIAGRVSVSFKLYPHRPLDYKTRMRKLGVHWDDGVKSIDLDNAIKVALDSLKGLAFDDDVWVRRILAERCEPDEYGARLVVTIEALDATSERME